MWNFPATAALYLDERFEKDFEVMKKMKKSLRETGVSYQQTIFRRGNPGQKI